MKRFIQTILLVVVCIGAFWYASSQNFFKQEDLTGKPQPLITLNEDDIVKIRINKGNIELNKNEDGKWTMTQPADYPVNTYSPDSWAGTFSKLMHEGEIDPEPADLSAFGLNNPEQQFTVTLADGTTKTLLVGSSLPIAGHHYAKLADAPAVYKLPDSQINSLQKEPFDFLERGPFKMVYNEVSSVKMDWKGQSKLLVKKDPTKYATETDWTLDGKDLSGREAEPMLDKMLLMSTDEMVKAASEVNVDSAEMRIELKSYKDGTETTDIYIGKIEEEKVWIVRQGFNWAYAMPVSTIQELFDRLTPPQTEQAPAQ